MTCRQWVYVVPPDSAFSPDETKQKSPCRLTSSRLQVRPTALPMAIPRMMGRNSWCARRYGVMGRTPLGGSGWLLLASLALYVSEARAADVETREFRVLVDGRQ